MAELTHILSVIDDSSLPLSRMAGVLDISASDLFAVERNDNLDAAEVVNHMVQALGYQPADIPEETLQGMQDAIDAYVHANYKIRYDQLSCRLLHDISAAFGFKSMAYREAWEHARATHKHIGEYSYVRCKAALTKDQVVAQGAEDLENIEDMPEWLGTMEVWSLSGEQYLPRTTDFFMPKFKFEAYQEPDIGEVRFMGWTSFPTSVSRPYHEEIIGGTEMIYDPEVSGYWVYPHGQTVSCSVDEFQDACQAFAGSPKALSFTVKNLSGFMRLNPDEEKDDPCKIVQWSNCYLEEHTHKLVENLTTDPNQQVSAIATFHCGKWGGDGNYLHNGGGTLIDDNLGLFGDELTIVAKAAKVDASTESLDIETKPGAESLPVIMYIGKRTIPKAQATSTAASKMEDEDVK